MTRNATMGNGSDAPTSLGRGMAHTQAEQAEKLRRESEELRFLGQLKAAHERGLLAIKHATELHGKNSLRLVPFYLVLVEISLQERQLKQAEEVLSLVNWLLVKDQKGPGATVPMSVGSTQDLGQPPRPELPEELKNLYVVRMNKLYSTLLMEYEVYPEALQRAAHGAYHCSLLFGPEHLYTSELYFCLGQIFSRMQHHDNSQSNTQRNSDNALGMFDKVVDIWYRFLTNPPEETAAWMLEHQRLRIQEATHMLRAIIQIRGKTLGEAHVATGEAIYTQALVLLYLGDHAPAKKLVREALDVYVANLGQEHPSTIDVKNVLQQLEEAGV
ncbi:hypothetical protein Poli38472_007825 [Pythium oligandrum]|uniref:Uncharacterized protein n=1 Tax=Pythium oligandrum TaxID=41045 RepID=A0A8K1CTT4_PYTOL|nr:hypothetical protein Poli38472_007825 [Pythium oligandrum]|eukprot:TMW68153.1 hypothetical protein Poli38472_007825 [Pythium oligandrum]